MSIRRLFRKACIICPWSVPLILILFYLLSCASRSEGPGGHYFRVSTVGGVENAITSGVPKFEGQLFEFEEVLRLHQDENRPESLLNRVVTFEMGEDGRFYVPDYGDNRIAVFDKDGEYSYSIGRQGEGPGEFQFVATIRIYGEQLIVNDNRLRRVSLFSTDGTFLKQYSVPLGSRFVSGIYPESDGRLVIDSYEYDMTDLVWQPQWDIITVLSASGDTLGRVEGKPWSFGKRVTVDRTIARATNYYGSRSSVQYRREYGILRYSSEEPVLEWFDLYGILIRTIRMDLTPEPVTDEEKSAIQRLLQEQVDEADNRQRPLYIEVKNQTVIPDVKSYWSGVGIDDYGYHWIGRHTDYTAPDPYGVPTRYMLLSPEGEYLGDVQNPESRGGRSRGHFLAISEDEETGEMHLIVYRMVPAVDGFEYP